MSKIVISEKVKQFIFEHIDSVELLEILLFLRGHQNAFWTNESLALEFRSNPNSVASRIQILKKMALLEEDSIAHSFKYKAGSFELEEILDELSENYKFKKQKIFELIFSPLKRGRHFANAFVVNPPKKGEGDQDG